MQYIWGFKSKIRLPVQLMKLSLQAGHHLDISEMLIIAHYCKSIAQAPSTYQKSPWQAKTETMNRSALTPRLCRPLCMPETLSVTYLVSIIKIRVRARSKSNLYRVLREPEDRLKEVTFGIANVV